MSIKGYNFTTPRTEEKTGHFNFQTYSMAFKILSLILLDRAKKASFLQHCAGCWGWGGGGAQLVVHTEHRRHARIQRGGGSLLNRLELAAIPN